MRTSFAPSSSPLYTYISRIIFFFQFTLVSLDYNISLSRGGSGAKGGGGGGGGPEVIVKGHASSHLGGMWERSTEMWINNKTTPDDMLHRGMNTTTLNSVQCRVVWYKGVNVEYQLRRQRTVLETQPAGGVV